MASPTFNGQKLFDSRKADGSWYPEGVLWAPDYSKITQTIHFNGEDGNRLVEQGWPDRPWVFRGLLSASSLVLLKAIFRAIQTEIDSATYHPLVDSFGNYYSSARIMHMHIGDIHIADDGYVAHVQVDGIIQGQVMDGETA